ncbi:TetR/AcrR family transcriptional regulator [Streptomyces sp. NPDC058682]|uniref:TetR/AcrR family transcriptional regulator n=1 Tax=Streptomyces sp. NPDC058682 TaxID=3346596 RepID=UPI003667B4C0
MKSSTSTAPAARPTRDPARVQTQTQAQTQTQVSATGVLRPRADAVRNRERILTAARELFVESGSTAPFDEVARRAGVGNATLYRHFPDRPTLVHHVVLFTMGRVTASAEASLAEEPDAFAALCRFTHAAADERIGALCPMLADGFDGEHPELLAARAALEEAVVTLLAAGQDAGLVRTDIGVGDLMVALSQLSRPLPGVACLDTDRFAHRHLQLFLDGLRAPARSELPGSATTLDDLRQKTM